MSDILCLRCGISLSPPRRMFLIPTTELVKNEVTTKNYYACRSCYHAHFKQGYLG